MTLEERINNNKERLVALTKKRENLDLEIRRLENKIFNQEIVRKREAEKRLLEKTFKDSETK